MPSLHLLRILVLGLAGAMPLCQAQSQPTRSVDSHVVADPAFEAAMLQYERNQWPQAYSALARLADAGHPQAARLALQMWRYGAALYGSEFAASAAQRRNWSALQDGLARTSGVTGARHPTTPAAGRGKQPAGMTVDYERELWRYMSVSCAARARASA